MTQIEILLGVALGLTVVNLVHCFFLSRKVKKNEKLMYKISEVVMKETMKTLVDNFHQDLENLFNPKDTKNENKRKTNDKVKHKN